MIPVDLRSDGLLWLINVALLHPRGFALAVDSETGGLSLLGNGSEPWRFVAEIGDAEFVAVERLLARARSENQS